MACVVECYNPALAAADLLMIPESLRAKLSAAGPSNTVSVSPGAFHSVLSQDLYSSEHSLDDSSSRGSTTATTADTADVVRANSPSPTPNAVATRAEPSSPPPSHAEQLGRTTPELAQCIHNTMRQREAALPPVQLASPQLNKRTLIVDFLNGACDILHLTRTTRFLAMLLVDHFMDKHVVMDYRLKLVALASLLVGAKFEESEDNMICMEQLQTMAHQCGENPEHYTKQEFLKMELYLLKFFDWSVSYPTAVHFAEYYLSTEDTEISEDEIINPAISGSQQDRVKMRAQMDRLTSCFLEASLRETLFLQYPSSLTASAALCAARICLGLPNAWNHKLTNVTRYDLPTMSHVVDHMLKLFYSDCDA